MAYGTDQHRSRPNGWASLHPRHAGDRQRRPRSARRRHAGTRAAPRPVGMKLLVDANLSPRIAVRLRQNGHEASHVGDHDLLLASDEEILKHAVSTSCAIISADSDFATMLALAGLRGPSLVLLRSADHLTSDEQASCSWRTCQHSWNTSNRDAWSRSALGTFGCDRCRCDELRSADVRRQRPTRVRRWRGGGEPWARSSSWRTRSVTPGVAARRSAARSLTST